MRDERWIVCVTDYDAGDAFCSAIGVECVGWNIGSAFGKLVYGIGTGLMHYRANRQGAD